MSINSNDFIHLFRGDIRPPEQIFNQGFQSRDPDAPITLGFGEGVHPDTAVCATTILDIAACFPFKHEKDESTNELPLRPCPKKTHVYLLKVPKKNVFLTYEDQLKRNSKAAFCQEVALKEVTPDSIVAAFEVDRFFYTAKLGEKQKWGVLRTSSTSELYGGEYRIQKLKFNNSYPITNEEQKCIEELFDQRVNNAVQIPCSLVPRQEMYTLQNQPPPVIFSLAAHKLHKRLTRAAVIIREGIPENASHYLKALTKVKNDYSLPFPVAKLPKPSLEDLEPPPLKLEETTLEELKQDYMKQDVEDAWFYPNDEDRIQQLYLRFQELT